jgi:acetyltransferase-like isoleucine patch superfamily enzyme
MLSYIPKSIELIVNYIRQAWIHYWLGRQGIRVARTAMIKGRCHISGDIEIGADTIIQETLLDGRGRIIIGRNVIVDHALVITAQHDIDSPRYETTFAPVVIGDYAVLYPRSVVLPGRTIGRGAIVAVGAVVTRDVPEMAVVAGNPARIIRYRLHIHSACDLRDVGGFFVGKRWKAMVARFISGLRIAAHAITRR